jgi:hypothetical protein
MFYINHVKIVEVSNDLEKFEREINAAILDGYDLFLQTIINDVLLEDGTVSTYFYQPMIKKIENGDK